MNLLRAYNQILINQGDVEKTAIITTFSLLNSFLCHFFLPNAGASFQRFIDSIFRDVPYLFVHTDDLLIFSPLEEEDASHLRQVFLSFMSFLKLVF